MRERQGSFFYVLEKGGGFGGGEVQLEKKLNSGGGEGRSFAVSTEILCNITFQNKALNMEEIRYNQSWSLCLQFFKTHTQYLSAGLYPHRVHDFHNITHSNINTSFDPLNFYNHSL